MRVNRGRVLDKKSLFSIGKLSKLTGVHIQSLRYYEELGILKPAYINPDSLYRYYTFSHMRIVEAIQYCADLDIPLKQFKNFILEKEKVEIARKVIDEALGGINNPNTGIMFGFDLAFVDGLNN